MLNPRGRARTRVCVRLACVAIYTPGNGGGGGWLPTGNPPPA
jgi:hypothetical protein